MSNDSNDKPLNQAQQNFLAAYVLGYDECLQRLEQGVPAEVLREKLTALVKLTTAARHGDTKVSKCLRDLLD